MTAGDSSRHPRREQGRRPGRPRAVHQMAGERRSWMDPREEILDVTAGLFVDRGFAITPTVEAVVAASCLRICQADQPRIDEAAARAADLGRALG